MIHTLLSLTTFDPPMWLVRLTFSAALIGLAALITTVLPGRTSAAYRHRVWGLSLAASLAVPFFIPWLPEFRLGPVAPSSIAEVDRNFQLPVQLPQEPNSLQSRLSQGPVVKAKRTSLENLPNLGRTASTRPPLAPVPSAILSSDQQAAPISTEVKNQTASIPAVSIWLLILIPPAVWKLCRAAQSVWTASCLAATAEPVRDAATLQKLGDLARNLGWHGRIPLRESSQTTVPLCVGGLRPVIVVPADWQTWPDVTLRAVLAHEIAHIVRRDVAWQHVARAASAVYWFHPAVWLAARQLRIEREAACDDCVLGFVTPASEYARVLLHFAQRLPTRPKFAADAVAMANGSALESRVRAILDSRRPRGAVRPLVSSLLLAATFALAVAAGSLSPAARAVSDDRSPTDKETPHNRPSTQADLRPQIRATLSFNELLQERTSASKSDPTKHAPRRESRQDAAISGRVVLRAAPGTGVPFAKILGVPINTQTPYLSAVCDKDGKFVVPPVRGTALFIAQNGERTLSGLAQFPARGGELVITIGATTSAHGRLLEVSTGKSVPHRQINYCVLVDGQKLSLPPGGRLMFCGKSTTNAQGEFTLSHLAPGWKYEIESEAVFDGSHEISYLVEEPKALARFEAPESGTVELGNVEIPERQNVVSVIARFMRHAEPFDVLLKARLERARLAEQRVLIVAGLPTDPWCQLIFTEATDNPIVPIPPKSLLGRNQTEPPLKDQLRNFAILGIDLSDPRLAAGFEAFLTKRGVSGRPIPSLAVVSPEGHMVRLRTLPVDDEDGRRRAALAEWLRQVAPPLPDAEKLLHTALAHAKAENKRILLEETAPHCNPCEQLTRYLEQHKTLLEKDYVLLKLDRRFPNGCSALTSLQHSLEGGVPSMAILDAEGKTLVDSNSPEGNIGFPESRREISYFEWMLRATSQRLSDEEIRTLVKALQKPLAKH